MTTGISTSFDRKNDRIKVSGFSVWPREIEKFLLERFAGRIKDVGVIGVPDEHRGETPLAFVVSGDAKLTADEIVTACREKLTGNQQLTAIDFVESIPKTPTGKILKGELRKYTAGVEVSGLITTTCRRTPERGNLR